MTLSSNNMSNRLDMETDAADLWFNKVGNTEDSRTPIFKNIFNYSKDLFGDSLSK